MARHCALISPHLNPYLPFLSRPKPRAKIKTLPVYPAIISSHSSSQPHECEDERNEREKMKQNPRNLINLSVTLTIISASLPQPSLAAAAGKSSGKKRASRKPEALTPQELKVWTEGLPVVTDRVPYTDILDLRRAGKLKHIIKPPGGPVVGLRQRTEAVLLVLEDSRVLRTVVPSMDRDRRFWELWDELKLDSVCMNAYSPPVKAPELPVPYLGFLFKIPAYMFSFVKPKPVSKRALEIKREREELKMSRKRELETMREERVMMEKAIREQKRMEDRRRRRELKKKKYQESTREARRKYERMANFWADLAADSNVATALGLLFFYIFYRTVVLSYRKQKKDYEDRLKIEKAEAEEKKKMRELEREMEGMEGVEDESETAGGEQNPYMKMAMQFMKSGARVRRAHNRRLPQYLERGVDVKFSDVAGLGKIRLELEEIVKFFTHGEMYRRRGVKIPG